MGNINRAIHKAVVTVDTTAGGTDLLTAAEQSTLDMTSVTVYPAAEIVIIYNAVGTATNSPYVCPALTPTVIAHTRGPLKAITASGSTSVRVAIGVGN